MKTVLAILGLGLGLALSLGSVQAQTAQQSKMTSCNKEAGDKALKGDERKAFMKDCLGAKPAAATSDKKITQQEKMKTCNKEAGDKALKGDERKAFMKDCLSNKG
ncbi:PsiF family protein [Rhodoferax sp. BLA1]|uniref:PsiF family protein n=1 Tax=Rhodoferax sp. BLA1 TaxID=2576062 RepID=UPI0015D3FD58|nr:PsiF family protein [Rhodoferax sp. BLA1]